MMDNKELFLQVGGFLEASTVDGPGIRQVLFISGCSFGCHDCHNPELQNFNSGKKMSLTEVENLFNINKSTRMITFSGGEPMEQAGALAELARNLKKKGIEEIIIYSGYTLEEIMNENDKYKLDLLRQCDLLIDGRYIAEKKSLDLPFRGSSNQEMIDLKKIDI